MVFTPKSLKLALSRRSLGKFAKLVQPSFEIAPVHAIVIEHLEKLLSGEIRELALVLPPRHGKSLLGSVMTPAFALGRDPTETIIEASYGSELSEIWGRRTRNLLGDPTFREIFPGCQLSQDSAAQFAFETTVGGGAIFVGRGGPVTGRGASLLVLDDLIKDATEANSEATCANIIEWLQSVALTRLTPAGRILAIGTRWSERDPLGWLLQQDGFTVLHLPALAEPGDPLSRKIGEALWPSKYSVEVLEKIRRDVGGRTFECLFQGNTSAAAGSIFKRAWFSYFDQRPEKIRRIVQSWDCSFKTGKQNDPSVCVTLAETDNGFYLLSLWRDKVEFPELKRKFAELADAWNPSEILIEDAASGQSLIQELKVTTNFPVIAVKVDRDKETRASAVTGYFESGRVLFPKDAPWLPDLESELCGFPGTLHDDQVDALSQVLNRMRQTGGALGLVDLYKAIDSGKRKLKEFFAKPKPAVVPIIAGPALARDEGSKGQPPRPPACAICGSNCVIWLGGPGISHCNQCGGNSGERPAALGCEPNCPGFLSQMVSGRIRCANCGEYHSPVSAAIGMSREQYGRPRLGRFR